MRTVWTIIMASASCAVSATLFAALPQQKRPEGAERPAFDEQPDSRSRPHDPR